MTDPTVAVSLTLEGVASLPPRDARALYRITGRSTVELRRAVASGEPLYTCRLFEDDHLEAVPRLEQAMAYLAAAGAPFRLHELVGGDRREISREVLDDILGGGAAPTEIR